MKISFLNNNYINQNTNAKANNSKPILNKGLERDLFVSFASSQELKSRKPIMSLSKEFDNSIKVLFPDIDGTIKGFDGKIPESARKALGRFEDNGLNIIISTGRTYTEGKDLYDQLGIKPNYMITQQGAEIVDKTGNIIYQNSLDPEMARLAVKAFSEYKKKFSNEDAKMVVYIDGKPYITEDFKLPYNWEEMIVVDSFTKLLDDGKIPTKILFYEPEGDKDDSKRIKELISYMSERLPDDFHVGHTAKHYCEITSPEATKGNALKVVLDKMGIDIKNAAAIGDSENDLDMLRVVKNGRGLSVCMGNGLETAKDAAEFETAHIAQDGFAKALDAIIQNNKRLSEQKVSV